MKFILPNIRHDKAGFESIARLRHATKDLFLEVVEVDMSEAEWFDADMCAVFGATLYGIKQNLNTVELVNIPKSVRRSLSKNGFLGHYGGENIPDSYETTIAYKRFEVEDERAFAEYIMRQFISREEIPSMSPSLLREFQQAIFEIFNNAVLHSNTKSGVFSCGQFFPHKNSLCFTLADLGVGIQANYQKAHEQNIAAVNAIDWAVKHGNSTKVNASGGLGLALLIGFIDLNGGSIQIVSADGYWQRKSKKTTKKKLRRPLQGTVVCITINTADQDSYVLESELTEQDIF